MLITETNTPCELNLKDKKKKKKKERVLDLHFTLAPDFHLII